MENKDNKKIEEIEDLGREEVGEDSTLYGEFISSYFAWISLPKQKENAERLENITKNKKEKTRKTEKK